jgi:hypothetical protein
VLRHPERSVAQRFKTNVSAICLTQPAARKIAEYHLDRYFEMVEAELNYRRKLSGERQGPEKANG